MRRARSASAASCKPAARFFIKLFSLEITPACYRQHREGRLSAEELAILLRSYAAHSHSDYLQVPYSDSLIGLAGSLIGRYPLRALDAIQLASALKLRVVLPPTAPSLVFLSADDRLVRIARRERLQVENPETFP